jgi:hypothetical protein
MGIWKRRRGRVEYLTPAQMLETLSLLRMRALVAHGAVWLAADRGAATALDLCCVGALEGGPSTAKWVAGLVGATRSTLDALADGGNGGGGGETGAQQQQQQRQQHQQLAGVAEAGGVSAANLRAVRLSPEEAMFFAHVLAPTLTAFELVEQEGEAEATQSARPLSTLELWRWCCGGGGNGGGDPGQKQQQAEAASDPLLAATIGREGRGLGGPQSPTRPCPFPHRYAAYCHLRAKGWLPRGGLLYGADFVLYGLHPALVHSEYVAVVLPLERRGAAADEHEQKRGGEGGSSPAAAAAVAAAAPRPPPQANGAALARRPRAGAATTGGGSSASGRGRGWWAEAPGAALRWVDAQIAQRLARQVFKQLLLVHVALPSSEADDEECLSDPGSVLARAKVRETVARRWVPPAGGGVAQALAEAAAAAGGGVLADGKDDDED